MIGLGNTCLRRQIAHAEDSVVALGITLQAVGEAMRAARRETDAEEIRKAWKHIVHRLADMAIAADDQLADC